MRWREMQEAAKEQHKRRQHCSSQIWTYADCTICSETSVTLGIAFPAFVDLLLEGMKISC